MSETVAEEDFQAAKAEVVEKLVRFLQLGDELGKPPLLVQAEFMTAFQEAIEQTSAAGASG